jgi:hypothetical protein
MSNAEPIALPDKLTLIAVSAIAYILAVALHEHLGHATACVLLGSHPLELGAFYVNCDGASGMTRPTSGGCATMGSRAARCK